MPYHFLKNGVDIEELLEVINTNDVASFYKHTFSSFETNAHFLRNGQQLYIANAPNRILSAYGVRFNVLGYKQNGTIALPGVRKGGGFAGRLVAELGPGSHRIEIINDYIYVDGTNTNIFAKAYSGSGFFLGDYLCFEALGGGGGGAGSGLTYCSAGGGGGAYAFITAVGDNPSFPFDIYVGKGGLGGNAQQSGNSGESTSITSNGYTISVGGGNGGGTDDASGGTGGVAVYNSYTAFIRNGGVGGKKESSGTTTSLTGYTSPDFLDVPNIPAFKLAFSGGASNGNNYGGGGGASALAVGAPANSRKEGVAGTLGAGGSGAGFTAFTSSRGGNGGDGLVRVYF